MRIEHIELRSVSYSYGDRPVFRDLNLTFKRGEKVAVTGRSGSGKTTLLKILSGIYVPTRGDVVVNGSTNLSKMDRWERAEFRRRYIGFSSQEPLLIDNLTPWDHVDIVIWCCGEDINTTEFRENIAEYAEALGVSGLLCRKVSKMSSGERKRIDLLLALAKKPDILILDEPTAFLDEKNASRVVEVIKGLEDSIVVFATHEDLLLRRLADKEVNLEEIGSA